VISDELTEVKRLYGDERRTIIVDADVELTIEGPDQRRGRRDHSYEIRLYQSARRFRRIRGRDAAERDALGATAKNEDFVEHLFVASTHAYLMIFTDDGQVFKMKVHEIPEAAPARGERPW
jgi:DNA gyrase subunit A